MAGKNFAEEGRDVGGVCGGVAWEERSLLAAVIAEGETKRNNEQKRDHFILINVYR